MVDPKINGVGRRAKTLKKNTDFYNVMDRVHYYTLMYFESISSHSIPHRTAKNIHFICRMTYLHVSLAYQLRNCITLTYQRLSDDDR